MTYTWQVVKEYFADVFAEQNTTYLNYNVYIEN